MRNITIKMYKDQTGKMVTSTVADKKLYQRFIEDMQPGQELEVHFSYVLDNGTYAQLSKLHVSIREIANYTGHSFDDVKALVKARAGFSFTTANSDITKSFSDMSKEELSSCIEETMRMGTELGLLL